MRYRILGEHTGLRVSEIVLGTAMFGTGWGYGTDRDESRRILDGYVDAGGNFLDTADTYQFGDSETFLGEMIAGRRDEFVVATKYTLGAAAQGTVSTTGNSRKNMRQSVEASLRRLRTDHIDLLWVHMPDGVTPMDEIVRGLDDLVRAGKIVYGGLSDFPAWRVARGATMAELRGWAPIAALQTEYSLVERTSDRELLPMSSALGLGVVGWSPLGGGVLTGKYRRGERGRVTEMKRVIQVEDTPQRTAVIDTLEAVAREAGSNPGRVAISWVASKGVIPIIGPRTRAQLDDNLAATELRLTPDQLRRLDEASAIPLGFPHDLLAAEANRSRLAAGRHDLVDAPARVVA
ncbi:aldo/keto reductase [Longimicrobium terrae]|uniref:Aryl-alcohol dehydrogenase-like predicted oxidoreductase n=1 Tax=Longimicrobium terrae TaxID=1639882 RepID=A0A841GJG6_9BACT|nr:aldo/keto reductase [Longimicrobium terrae]MBB4634403.1 aryl-alcohol dehydrogenase-like predicted oxidoreductase [Longimicrobium terrae]MBB6068707.1 aryl-alcohol dehydrogenase-like predicted oxidoreductase [Longimicrobium terrae]NNC27893.1 aldo/keto reductase [Longimicrobium terrae]